MGVLADSLSPALVSAAPAGTGVRGVAALSARVAYAFMCLTLCWGVLTTTGWAHRLAGRRTVRGGHLVLATITLCFGTIHALSYRFLGPDSLGLPTLMVPLLPGSLLRHTLGVVGLQLMLAIALTAGLYRWTAYRRWIWLHRTAYLAFLLLVLHSLFGAIAGGSLAVLWLGGTTLLVPAVTLAALRFLPTRTLKRFGILEERV
ncbi:ferric reductase-like transmembrane domain-containing protein [Amycolatopsis aidingensis]|uniref:ferric reductase-like transmembrane domain-containing protein n=1 Tax=Amycolatopsis aidingensis TaxID=2842453 RepID=UPI001C0C6FA4|nr:ferric reductase-like transmembrane domain-containing protein [Amycolatopsis aidingensis]